MWKISNYKFKFKLYHRTSYILNEALIHSSHQFVSAVQALGQYIFGQIAIMVITTFILLHLQRCIQFMHPSKHHNLVT